MIKHTHINRKATGGVYDITINLRKQNLEMLNSEPRLKPLLYTHTHNPPIRVIVQRSVVGPEYLH